MTLTASAKEEAERTAKLLERAIDRITNFKFPELIIVEPDNSDVDDDDYDDDADDWNKFECPWCHHVEYIEEYRVVTVATDSVPICEPNSAEDTTFEVAYDDGDQERADMYLECGSCKKPVSLPSEYELEPY